MKLMRWSALAMVHRIIRDPFRLFLTFTLPLIGVGFAAIKGKFDFEGSHLSMFAFVCSLILYRLFDKVFERCCPKPMAEPDPIKREQLLLGMAAGMGETIGAFRDQYNKQATADINDLRNFVHSYLNGRYPPEIVSCVVGVFSARKLQRLELGKRGEIERIAQHTDTIDIEPVSFADCELHSSTPIRPLSR